ncbi:hybrid sensor histidine kinase/response regulator [Ketobacter alkanivorans]|uniref:Sensory/regulatory protein RpfC n=1 Tax=Ketobacter alkanivorans TaxID=1917421 RepID=A0A2K9LN90_9GAMM|nr:hybrid sensor histidine kinase/response regulator [Ketobacter alkanivorans]AUM13839.1 hypothetical protein Kalk_16010 [Ketobacter alkanivorans]
MQCSPWTPPTNDGKAPYSTLFLMLLMLLMLCGLSTQAYCQITIHNQFTSQPAGLHAQLFLDREHSIQLYDAMTLPDELWITPQTETTSFGFSPDRLWLKLPIANNSDHTQRLGLEIAYPVLDLINAYVTQDGFVQAQYSMGDTFYFEQRPVDFRNFIVPFQLPPGETITLYLSIDTEGTLQAPITLWDMDHFFEKQQPALVAHGLYFGIMLVMILYNLFIYISIRHITYLYYTVAALACATINASMQGLGFQFVWASWPELNAVSIPASIAVFGISSKLFSITLLNMPTTAPTLYKLKLGIIVGYSLTLISLFFMPYHSTIRIVMLVGVCSILLGTYTGLYLFLKGHRIARFYLLAWSCLFGALFLTALSKAGVIPSSHFIEHSLQYGSALEVILLSFAMADRINQERTAKRKAEQLAIISEKRASDEASRYLELKYQKELDELKTRQEIIQAQAESKAKSEFLATMSHEIRTPMNGVLGMTELLRETHLDPNQRHYLNVVSSSGKALLNIINDILDYSKITAGKMEIEQIDFDLDQLCLECASVFSLTAERKHLELVSSLEPGTPALIKSDPSRLRQIIINLLGNAFKFTNTGHVSLRVMQQDPLCEGQLTLRFEVRDTGVGIAPEKQQMLFSAFNQLGNSVSREYGGTGLGLSISKRLAHLMGGQIGVESRQGEGSCFWFTIQCQPADAQFSRQHIVPLTSLGALKLLIVDDSPEFTHVLQEQTAAWGAHPEVAHYGEQALEKLKAATAAGAPFNVITMDMNMSGMNGLECARQIHAAGDIANCYCILLTAMNSTPSQPELEAAGIDIAMKKPASAHALRQAILNLLQGRTEPQATNGQLLSTAFNGKTVLVAEDNSVNQLVIVGMLKKLGLKCEVADNGEQALTLFTQRANHFDLVFMDCEMPVMDGYSTCRKIREHEAKLNLPPTPVIALTAHAMPEHKTRALEAGMDAHIPKPVELLTVQETLIEFLISDDPASRSA